MKATFFFGGEGGGVIVYRMASIMASDYTLDNWCAIKICIYIPRKKYIELK